MQTSTRSQQHDPPELVRLADGFLYERVPRPVLVRSGRSITPESPASPALRRRPMLEPNLPRHVHSTNKLTSTNGVIGEKRHDPEMAIPSIERDQTPDPAHPRRDGFVRSYQAATQDIVNGTSQNPAPRRPVERLSDRIELIRLDGVPAGSKRRLDDAFSAEESQIQPQKIQRPDTGHSVPTRILPGGDEALTGRSYQRQLEGKVTNSTSELYRRQEIQSPPRLIRQAVPVRKFQDTSSRFAAEPYGQNPDVIARSSGPTSSHPVDRYYIERSPERSVRTDKRTHPGIRSSRMSPSASRTVSLSHRDLPTEGESPRLPGKHDPNISFQDPARIRVPYQRTVEHGRHAESYPTPSDHHDRLPWPHGQPTGSSVSSSVRDYSYSSRRINGDSSMKTNRNSPEVVFLGAVKGHDASFSSHNRNLQSTMSPSSIRSQNQQSNSQVKAPQLSEYIRTIEYDSPSGELLARRPIYVGSRETGHRRYERII